MNSDEKTTFGVDVVIRVAHCTFFCSHCTVSLSVFQPVQQQIQYVEQPMQQQIQYVEQPMYNQIAWEQTVPQMQYVEKPVQQVQYVEQPYQVACVRHGLLAARAKGRTYRSMLATGRQSRCGKWDQFGSEP